MGFEHGVELRLSSRASQRRTDLLRVLTDDFAMNA
jgi:putative transposase